MDTYNALMAILREIEPFGWMIVLSFGWFWKSGVAKDFAALTKEVAALKKDVAALTKEVAALAENLAAVTKDVAVLAKDVARVEKAVDRTNARIDEFLGKPREATEPSAPSVVIRAEHIAIVKPEADALRVAVQEVHQSVPADTEPAVEPPERPLSP